MSRDEFPQPSVAADVAEYLLRQGVERVFSLPGLGGLLIDAVNQRDLPLLLGCTLFAAFLVVLANALVDLCYGALDPRARLT